MTLYQGLVVGGGFVNLFLVMLVLSNLGVFSEKVGEASVKSYFRWFQWLIVLPLSFAGTYYNFYSSLTHVSSLAVLISGSIFFVCISSALRYYIVEHPFEVARDKAKTEERRERFRRKRAEHAQSKQ